MPQQFQDNILQIHQQVSLVAFFFVEFLIQIAFSFLLPFSLIPRTVQTCHPFSEGSKVARVRTSVLSLYCTQYLRL